MERVLILDGYTDEPAGLGVPPYMDVYPRYIAGAVWTFDKSIKVIYVTVDQAREDVHRFLKLAQSVDLLVVVAGVTVPGKYLGGTPIRLSELRSWFMIVDRPLKLLVGPAARFGIGLEGGRVAELPTKVKECFDLVVRGDPEVVVYELLREGVEGVDPDLRREGYELVDEFAVRGALIVRQHPCYGRNLIAEVETFRGCPRAITGGCSFCIEPLYGLPVFRDQMSVVREVEALWRAGVRFFRLGRQPDILAYKARGVGDVEFPTPVPEELEKLFKGIRCAAPGIEVLHIDNVNPGTIAHSVEESREALKVIVRYHTPGDVAAMGIETADPRVVKLNNLKVYPDEALTAIRVVNEVGSRRGWNGLPEILPGVNFVHGLLGETKETYRLNMEFMRRVFEEGLMVRRINIRQVMAFPGTPMWEVGDRIMRRHKRIYKAYVERMRREIDIPMMMRVVPRWTVLRRVFTEKHISGKTYSRQVGSYPVMVVIPFEYRLGEFIDVIVIGHSSRSVRGLPYPIRINEVPPKALKGAPGMTRTTMLKVLSARPIRSREQLESLLGPHAHHYTL